MSMSRKNRTPEENARRTKIRELLQEANITSMADIQNLFSETIAEFMKNGLEVSWMKNSDTANMIFETGEPTTPEMFTAARS